MRNKIMQLGVFFYLIYITDRTKEWDTRKCRNMQMIQ